MESVFVKMAVLVCLATPVACLIGAGIACMLPSTMESLNNAGAHGFSEVLYAYSSGAGNNGSAFAGFNANTPFLNISIGLVMIFVRFVPLLATLAIAGSMVEKKRIAESAITGESAPVIRESGGDRSAVTGGTTVVSDWLVIRVTCDTGESFLDKMIAMVEGASRKKTPNEIALQILLVALTIIFLLVTVSLFTFSEFDAKQYGMMNPSSLTALVALLVCLAPTTIGALLSAIGIAGMSRLNQANVLAMSGRAIEAAGDVDVLLLDKTGTITLGNRQAAAFYPMEGTTP